LRTVLSRDHQGVVEGEAFLVKRYEGSDACSIDNPVPSITANWEHLGLARPYLIKYYGTSDGQALDDPLGTVTAKDRFGLVIPELGAILDIRFRMLQPHELAAAQGFPRSYSVSGKRKDKVKQIGNAVPVQTARALCYAILTADQEQRIAA